jgi:hypothetical protein
MRSWYTFKTLSSLVDQQRSTLQAIDALADHWCSDPQFVFLARDIVSDIRSGDHPSETEAINQWIQRNISYRGDPLGTEWLQDPRVTLQERAGDCDDMSCLAATLLQAIGHPCQSVKVQWVGDDLATHVVCHDLQTKKIVDPVARGSIFSWPPYGYQIKRMENGDRMPITMGILPIVIPIVMAVFKGALAVLGGNQNAPIAPDLALQVYKAHGITTESPDMQAISNATWNLAVSRGWNPVGLSQTDYDAEMAFYSGESTVAPTFNGQYRLGQGKEGIENIPAYDPIFNQALREVLLAVQEQKKNAGAVADQKLSDAVSNLSAQVQALTNATNNPGMIQSQTVQTVQASQSIPAWAWIAAAAVLVPVILWR